MKNGRHDLNSIVCSSLLFWGSIIPHVAMGGEFVSPKKLIIQALSILLLFSGLKPRLMQGPQLAMAILIAQCASHFILGGMHNSSLKMAFAHIFAGFITYSLIAKFQTFLLKITKEFFASVFKFQIFHNLILKFENILGFLNLTTWRNLFQERSYRDRGPPSLRYV